MPEHPTLRLAGDANSSCTISLNDLSALPRFEQISDFHCVTTWSVQGLRWGGYRFRDFHDMVIQPRMQPAPNAQLAVFRCLDGFRVSLPLEDLLADDVLLADQLNGEPLTQKHGAPLRIVAPAHYGYKNPKHQLWEKG